MTGFDAERLVRDACSQGLDPMSPAGEFITDVLWATDHYRRSVAAEAEGLPRPPISEELQALRTARSTHSRSTTPEATPTATPSTGAASHAPHESL